LIELGFVWTPFEDRWEAQFRELQAYYDRRKHAPLPSRETRPLTAWAHGQRKNKHRLSPAQIRKLDSIGFDWVRLESASGKARVK